MKNIFITILFGLINLVIYLFFGLIYFFLISFICTSEYGKGGWGGKLGTTGLILLLFTILIIIIISQIIILKKFKPNRFLQYLYVEFQFLKWSSFFAFILGLWSTWYFYHTEGLIGLIAMIFWNLIIFFVYFIIKRISENILYKIKEKQYSQKWDYLTNKVKNPIFVDNDKR